MTAMQAAEGQAGECEVSVLVSNLTGWDVRRLLSALPLDRNYQHRGPGNRGPRRPASNLRISGIQEAQCPS